MSRLSIVLWAFFAGGREDIGGKNGVAIVHVERHRRATGRGVCAHELAIDLEGHQLAIGPHDGEVGRCGSRVPFVLGKHRRAVVPRHDADDLVLDREVDLAGGALVDAGDDGHLVFLGVAGARRIHEVVDTGLGGGRRCDH